MRKISAAITLALLSINVNAEIINTNWKKENDRKAVLHVESGLEFLKPSETKGLTYDYLVSEMVNGGKYDGWRFAKEYEVKYMLQTELNSNASYSEFYDWDKSYSSVRNDNLYNLVYNLHRKFGYTDTSSGSCSGNSCSRQYNLGYVYENGLKKSFGTAYVNVLYKTNYANYYNGYTPTETHGAWLVSDGGVTISSIENPSLNIGTAPYEVPLPASALLLGLGLTGLRLRARKNK